MKHTQDKKVTCETPNCKTKNFLIYKEGSEIEFHCIKCNRIHYLKNVIINTIKSPDLVVLEEEIPIPTEI